MLRNASVIVFGLGAASVIVSPFFRVSKASAVERTPQQVKESANRARANLARLKDAYEGLQGSDPARQARARRTMHSLEANDFHRYDLAKILAARGEAQEAYQVARPAAHYNKFDADDAEMSLYAKLAEAAGHPEEAKWARGRMGDVGHFRIEKERLESMFMSPASPLPSAYRAHYVNRHIDAAIEGFPKHREELEAIRQDLLGGVRP